MDKTNRACIEELTSQNNKLSDKLEDLQYRLSKERLIDINFAVNTQLDDLQKCFDTLQNSSTTEILFLKNTITKF